MPAVVRKLRGSCKNFSLLLVVEGVGAVVGKKPIDFLANPTHHQTSAPLPATLLLPINALFYIVPPLFFNCSAVCSIVKVL